MKELVELLAENTHMVWARERIKASWTYGLTEVRANAKGRYGLTEVKGS